MLPIPANPLPRRPVRPSSLPAVLLSCAALLSACGGEPAPAAAPAGPLSPPEWARSATLYEINVRQYTPEGTFRALLPALPRIRAVGADILWVMPIQPIGRTERKGGLGSYYSVADYTAINPEFGTLEDFKIFVDSAHALGMRVILDWVANHTAFDHPWTTAHPEWYTKRPDGTISRAIDDKGKETDWSDVADLDYASAAMRAEMIRSMRWWVEQTGLDGFRCDVAGFVPYDFWDEARDALLATRSDLFLLAEWEDAALHTRFHATYGWELHHLLNKVAKGEEPATAFERYLERQRASFPAAAFRMHFTSNHDENSWNGTEFERMGANHQAAFVVASTFEGALPLVYSGQEASNRRRLRFFDKDTIDWRGPSLAEFYGRLAQLKDSVPALHNGAWGGRMRFLPHDGGERVTAFERGVDGSHAVVVVNFGPGTRTVTVRDVSMPGDYRDGFTGVDQRLEAVTTLSVPAGGWRLLVR